MVPRGAAGGPRGAFETGATAVVGLDAAGAATTGAATGAADTYAIELFMLLVLLLLPPPEPLLFSHVPISKLGVLGVTIGGGTIDFFFVASCGLAGWLAIDAHVSFFG